MGGVPQSLATLPALRQLCAGGQPPSDFVAFLAACFSLLMASRLLRLERCAFSPEAQVRPEYLSDDAGQNAGLWVAGATVRLTLLRTIARSSDAVLRAQKISACLKRLKHFGITVWGFGPTARPWVVARVLVILSARHQLSLPARLCGSLLRRYLGYNNISDAGEISATFKYTVLQSLCVQLSLAGRHPTRALHA